MDIMLAVNTDTLGLPGSVIPILIGMDNTRFRRFPRELTDEIWRLALHFSDGVELEVVTNDNDDLILRATIDLREPLPLALTRACGQIHEETEGMFYNINTFRLPTNRDSEDSDGG